MSANENKEIIRAFYDAINRKDLDSAEQYADENVVTLGIPGVPPGRAAFRAIGEMFQAGFPDAVIVLDDLVSEGNKIATRFTMTGTHTGDFMGIPATGRYVQLSGVHIDRIANGKIVERYVMQDQLSLMQQLGILPSPNQPATV